MWICKSTRWQSLACASLNIHATLHVQVNKRTVICQFENDSYMSTLRFIWICKSTSWQSPASASLTQMLLYIWTCESTWEQLLAGASFSIYAAVQMDMQVNMRTVTCWCHVGGNPFSVTTGVEVNTRTVTCHASSVFALLSMGVEVNTRTVICHASSVFALLSMGVQVNTRTVTCHASSMCVLFSMSVQVNTRTVTCHASSMCVLLSMGVQVNMRTVTCHCHAVCFASVIKVFLPQRLLVNVLPVRRWGCHVKVRTFTWWLQILCFICANVSCEWIWNVKLCLAMSKWGHFTWQ